MELEDWMAGTEELGPAWSRARLERAAAIQVEFAFKLTGPQMLGS